MNNSVLIPIDLVCLHYEVKTEFVLSLQEYGLLNIVQTEEGIAIYEEQLGTLQKVLRLHNELDINREGIEVVFQLLHKIDNLEEQVRSLKSHLAIYEE